MKRFPQILLFVAAFSLAACSSNKKNDQNNQKEPSEKGTAKESKKMDANNPFAEVSELPYQAPDFDKIDNDDFLPAIEEGMRRQLSEVDKIANNPEAASFENTLIAMEKSGQLLNRVSRVFNLLTGANTNPELQKIQEKVAPKRAAHRDAIYLNQQLFKRIAALHDKKEKLNLDGESKHLIDYYYQEFVRAGAKLSEAKREKLKKLNEKEASLSAQFVNRLLAATKAAAYVVDDKSKLDGLSEDALAAAAQKAEADGKEGHWKIPLQNTTQQPDLQNLNDRESRKALFENSWNRAEQGDSNDTRKIIKSLAELRAEKAEILGFPNYAAWKLQNQMAKKPENVTSFLGKLVPAAMEKAKKEAADIQKLIEQQGADFDLKAYDWNYYAEKIRKEKYNLDEDEIKAYFEMDQVLEKGVFYAANQLYGLIFKKRKDLPVYHEDVRVFEVMEADSSSIGLFYTDFFARENKRGGAWMSNLVGQSKLLDTKPVIYNICNFPKAAEGKANLISYDNVTTMFHEFGHALHGLFADQKFPSLSGTNTPRDFVEFPSQVNEHWALNPKILKNYALHHKTGEAMPQALIDKIKKASTFNQGYALTELLAAAELDMEWHTIKAEDNIESVNKFEKTALKTTGLNFEPVPPRYRSSYFMHIWSNGYASGYYAYLWTEMLEADAYRWFQENGGMTRENGQKFREMILSRGNTKDFAELYKDFRGSAAKIEPMLEGRGLDTP